MPNIVGIQDATLDQSRIASELSRQLRTVDVDGVEYAEHKATFPGFGMGLLDHGILENGPQPVCSDDQNVWLMLDGEIYNDHELRQQYCKGTPGPMSTPELCLRLLTRYGFQFARNFNGLFAIVIYERAAQRLTFISDRYAFRPLFYVHRQPRVLFGTELKALAAIDPQKGVDELGLLELFCYGCQAMGRTWMRGYKRLGAATILSFDSSGEHSERYWTFKYDEAAPTLDQPTYFTRYAYLFDRAVERCMRGSHRIGMFLSGGYDSRCVAAAIRKHHLPIPAFTFGRTSSRDVRFASMMAERLGLEHLALTDEGPYLYSNCRAITSRCEGMLPFADLTSIRYHKLFKSKMDVILTGFLGDFSGSHTWPALLRARTREATIAAIFDRVTGERVARARRIFTHRMFHQNIEVLQARFRESFETVSNDRPLNIADAWLRQALSPQRTSQSTCVDRYLFEVRAPHMDSELVEFLLAIPPYSRLEQRVYKRMIAYSYPEIRDVPCTNSGRPIEPRFAWEYVKMVTNYGIRGLNSVFGHQSLEREFRDLNDDFRAEPELIEHILQPLLRSGVFDPDIFSLREIEAMVDEHYRGRGNYAPLLAGLITWGLASQMLLGDAVSPEPLRKAAAVHHE